MKALEARKAELAEQINNCGRPLRGFDETFRTAFDFLANPQKLWLSERIEDKRAVLKLVFASMLAYARNEGFLTADLTLSFKVLGAFRQRKVEMARPGRFELPTF